MIAEVRGRTKGGGMNSKMEVENWWKWQTNSRHSRNNKENNYCTGCGFSVKGSNNGRLASLEMNDVNYVKNNYTDLRNISDNLNVRPFNPELPGSLRPQENLHKLKDAKIFSSMDACGAYHCIQIEEWSRDYTAFISPFGTSWCTLWIPGNT